VSPLDSGELYAALHGATKLDGHGSTPKKGWEASAGGVLCSRSRNDALPGSASRGMHGAVEQIAPSLLPVVEFGPLSQSVCMAESRPRLPALKGEDFFSTRGDGSYPGARAMVATLSISISDATFACTIIFGSTDIGMPMVFVLAEA
jgi:hypothetical protein